MAQPAQPPAGAEPKLSDQIPPLNNIAPSIFVPLRDDILQTELPGDRVERLKHILKTLDYQRDGVKENLLYMFEREKKRIILQAAEMERAGAPPKVKPGLPANKVDDIIANMEAPAVPKMDYNIRDMPPLDVTVPIPPDASLRDRTVLELLTMVERGLGQLEGYERYITNIKKQYLDRLHRELAMIEEAGKRPEERSGAKWV